MKNCLILSALLATAGIASAHESAIHLKDCAIQKTLPGAKATGAFLTIEKHGNDALSLVSAAAPELTDHVEIHEMVMAEGSMKMQEIKAYALQAGDNVFKRGGYHIMLMNMEKTMQLGEQYPLHLTFSDGSTETCQATVKSVEMLTPKGMKHHHHHDMKKAPSN